MPDRYLLESGSPDGYLLEDGSGVLLLDAPVLSSTLTDNFDDNSRDTAKWNVGSLLNAWSGTGYSAGTSETNGRVEATAEAIVGTPAGYVSVNTYQLDSVYIAVTNNGSGEAQFAFGPDYSNIYRFNLESSTVLTAQKVVAGVGSNLGYVSLSYTNSAHKWWRIRWGGTGDDNVYFDTAPDTASNPPTSGQWVNGGTFARDPAIALTNGKVSFVSVAGGATPPTLYFDGFNTATTASTGYTLTAAAGAFSLSGTAASLKAARTLTAASGSFALSGAAAALKKGFKLTAASGAFSLSGTAASFPVTRKLAAAAASFILSGTAATLKRGLKITAASGSFALTGTAATLSKTTLSSYTLTAVPGSFAVSGTAATLKRGLKLSAATGSYSLTGTAATLKRGLRLTANSGSYALSGTAATFTQSGSRSMTALPAAFVITGSASTRRLNSAGGGGSIAFFLS